jgi:dinuclear metal center YbgI/SA1388 family protein
MQLSELVHYTDVLLDAPRFRDYCPNGLQVEGRPEVRRIVTGVTACLDLLRAAVDAGADAILVHHGYFWRNDDPRVTGFRRQRLQWLLHHELSLIAYHLPLDAHRTLGNNIQLGTRLGLDSAQWFGEQDLATLGRLPETMTLAAFADRVETCLGRKPLVVGDGQRLLGRLAWCTGAAQGYMEEAVRLGADAYLTGEISEQTVHIARETGVALIAAGHHATERYGVRALGAHLAEQFGLAHEFIDIPNPV